MDQGRGNSGNLGNFEPGDAGDAMPVGPVTPKAASVRSFRLNRLAMDGPPSVAGGEGLDFAAATVERSALERGARQRTVHHFVGAGMVFSDCVTRGGMTLERVAAEHGLGGILGELRVLRDIWLYRACCRGSLDHLACTGVAQPFTLIQAEIAAGIRNFDGERVGPFAEMG